MEQCCEIKTFVFFDTETTGLPCFNFNKTSITELSLHACSSEDVSKGDIAPRVQHKLSLCFNPALMISPGASNCSALYNELLENENKFDENAGTLLNAFIKHLQQPVCLVAHNGNAFDFPILKKAFEKLQMTIPDNVLCLDSLKSFREIEKKLDDKAELGVQILHDDENILPTQGVLKDEGFQTLLEHEYNTIINNKEDIEKEKLAAADIFSGETDWQKINEVTPKRSTKFANTKNAKASESQILNSNQKPIKSRKKLFSSPAEKPARKVYKLPIIYERRFGRKPVISHFAEADVETLKTIAISFGAEFVENARRNAVPFLSIKALGKK